MAGRLTRPQAVLEEIFNRNIAMGERLRSEIRENGRKADRDRATEALTQWDANAQKLLEGAFTDSSPASPYPAPIDMNYLTSADSYAGDIKRVVQAFDKRLEALRSIRDMLGLYDGPAETILAGREHPASSSSSAAFIVHGRADGPKEQVARFLERATDAEPIILHEQAKRGQVIIESLEAFAATAAFAIVLLTGDDYGGIKGSPESNARARQTVVFELGFFIGALGRSRVAVLYEETVELPSDMNGILYTTLDSQGAWRLSLGRELRAAGFAVDLNRAT